MTSDVRTAYELISADDHFNEPPDTWQARVPERLKEAAPKVVRMDHGDVWVVDGESRGGLGLGSLAGRDYKDFKASGLTYDDLRPGFYEPGQRLKDLDEDGVWASVIYPTIGIGIVGIKDPELHEACVRAYNGFVADFNATDPRRLFGVGVLPRTGVKAAVSELEHLARSGLRGALLQSYPSGEKLPTVDDEPFWAAAQEIGLPLHVHVTLAGRFDNFFAASGGKGPMNPNLAMVISGYALISHGCQEAFSQLIFSGILDRYPSLKWVAVEGGIGWVHYFLERWDNSLERQRHWANLDLKLKPSDYWRRQVYATFEEDTIGVELAVRRPDICPVDNLLWASDYPHSDTTWPRSREVVRDHFKDMPDEARRKIVWENSAKLYKVPDPPFGEE